ncbi:MAG: response regulator [Anaerolineae bacterium]|nr:response regulator [Anaerolineae bacterium]
MGETPKENTKPDNKQPAQGEPSKTTGDKASQESIPEKKISHKVLIVEDTTELAEVLQVTLERMNLTVFCTTHGAEALDLATNEKPDLVLLDIALPDTTGWKVLDTIREQQKGGKGPLIVVITAYGDPANRLMGKLQGIHAYLIKPFKTDEVERVVAEALGLEKE